MPVPQSKAELLAAIQKEYRKLRVEIGKVPESEVLALSMDGHARGTRMSVHNLLAYLVGWNELVLKWHARWQAGEPVDFPETGYQWNQLGQLAQKFYQDYESLPFAELVQRLEMAKERIIQLIEQHEDNVLYGQPWYNQWTLGRMIQFNTSSPYANACGRLRKRNKAA